MRVMVLGMHRSGTSVLVRALEALGLWAGREEDFHPATAHDPQGHREHRLVWALDEAALAAVDRAWDEPVDVEWHRMAPGDRDEIVRAARMVVETLDSHPSWVVKDPRLCLTLPLWREVVSPACVLVHRDPLEVARSLAARDGLPLVLGLALWEAYTRAMVRNSHGLDRLLVSFADLIAAPDASMRRLTEWPRERSGEGAVRARGIAPFDERVVRHHALPDETLALMVPAQQRLLHEVHETLAGGSRELDALAEVCAEPLSLAATETITTHAAHRRALQALRGDRSSTGTAARAHA
jgi:hypothetical protein